MPLFAPAVRRAIHIGARRRLQRIPTITSPLAIRSAHATKKPVSIRVNVARLRMFSSPEHPRVSCPSHRGFVLYIC